MEQPLPPLANCMTPPTSQVGGVTGDGSRGETGQSHREGGGAGRGCGEKEEQLTAVAAYSHGLESDRIGLGGEKITEG